jgi:hypothetical protein
MSLIKAATDNNIEEVTRLLRNGANICEADIKGLTALHYGPAH